MPCSILGHQAIVGDRLLRKTALGVDMTRCVVSEGLAPASGLVMFAAPAEGAHSIELAIEQADAPFDRSTPLLEEGFFLGRVLKLPALFGGGGDRDALLFQLRAAGIGRPIRIITEEPTLEIRLQERVKALNVVAVAGKLESESDTASRRKDQMLSNTVEPALQRCAVTGPGKAGEPLLPSRPDRAADIDRMGVDDEKGGVSSSSILQKTDVSFFMRGVSRARRSAQFCLESRRGNRESMTGCLFSH